MHYRVDLVCEAKSCKFNKNSRCCRGGIYIKSARRYDNKTECYSFEEKDETHFWGHETRFVPISCEATHCFYNEDEQCCAGTVTLKEDTKRCKTLIEK